MGEGNAVGVYYNPKPTGLFFAGLNSEFTRSREPSLPYNLHNWRKGKREGFVFYLEVKHKVRRVEFEFGSVFPFFKKRVVWLIVGTKTCMDMYLVVHKALLECVWCRFACDAIESQRSLVMTTTFELHSV